MEKITNKKIRVAYTLISHRNGESEEVEKTTREQPFEFLSGVGYTLDAFEENLKELKKGAETARKYGKFAGTVGNPGNVKDLYDMGYRYVNLCADVAILGRNFREVMEKYQTAMGK